MRSGVSCTYIVTDGSKALSFSIHRVIYAREGMILIFPKRKLWLTSFANTQVSHSWLKKMKWFSRVRVLNMARFASALGSFLLIALWGPENLTQNYYIFEILWENGLCTRQVQQERWHSWRGKWQEFNGEAEMWAGLRETQWCSPQRLLATGSCYHLWAWRSKRRKLLKHMSKDPLLWKRNHLTRAVALGQGAEPLPKQPSPRNEKQGCKYPQPACPPTQQSSSGASHWPNPTGNQRAREP